MPKKTKYFPENKRSVLKPALWKMTKMQKMKQKIESNIVTILRFFMAINV